MFFAAPDNRKIKNVKVTNTSLVGNAFRCFNVPNVLRDRNGKLLVLLNCFFDSFISKFVVLISSADADSDSDCNNVNNVNNVEEFRSFRLSVLLNSHYYNSALSLFNKDLSANDNDNDNDNEVEFNDNDNDNDVEFNVCQSSTLSRNVFETSTKKLTSCSFRFSVRPSEPLDGLETLTKKLTCCSLIFSFEPFEVNCSRVSKAAHSKPYVSRLLQKCGDIEQNPGPGPGPGGSGSATPTPASTSSTPSRCDPVLTSASDEQPDEQPVKGQVCDVQVFSLNVRGLTDSKKVRHLVNNCYKLSRLGKDNVFLFQETFVPSLGILDYIWRGEYHLTPGTGNSMGCVTLVTAPFKIVSRVDIGQRGHILALSKNDVNRVDVIVVNIYAPNGFDTAKLNFFAEVLEKTNEVCESLSCRKLILAGDLNVVFGDNEVVNRQISQAEKRVAVMVKNTLTELNLADGWGDTVNKSYTWTSNRNGNQSFSTLDRICYTKSSLNLVTKIADWGLTLSDHAAVIARFNNKISQDGGYKKVFIPRLDTRLLDDLVGRELMARHFEELLAQADVNWNPHVKLEHCKMCMRTAANAATGKIKAQLRDEELVINTDINNIIDELSNEGVLRDRRELLTHKLDDLRRIKRSLIAKIGNRLAQKTSRKWYNEGELSNKYFFGILNRKVNDDVEVLINDDGKEVVDKDEIEAEVRGFYQSLYEVKDDVIITNEFFANVTPIHPDQASSVEKTLTLDDLATTLQSCKDSAPGPDGIPYSYLKHFWKDIGPLLLQAWQYSLNIGSLPPFPQNVISAVNS